MTPQAFIAKWHGNPLSEKAGAQSFFLDLCDLLGVAKPDDSENYCFERGATRTGAGHGWADVWMRGFFAWESKAPGKDLGVALKQLMTYALALDNPPLLVVSDRSRIEIHTHFTGTPSEVHSITLEDIGQPQNLQKLRWLFESPERFKPQRTTYAVTEEAARKMGKLAERLNAQGRTPLQTAHFLIQCVFCMFAEDARLLPEKLFETVLDKSNPDGAKAQSRLTELFTAMRRGGDFALETIPYFNGGLFEQIEVPPLTTEDVVQLLDAARMGWGEIEPAILGTLFERGLNPDMRSQLGAHYTDPATILKLIRPVIEAPLLAEWQAVKMQIAALLEKHNQGGKGSKTARDDAQAAFIHFIQRLKGYRFLDPACGSGNFLYVTLELLKRLEGEVLQVLEQLGGNKKLELQGFHIRPEQFHGLELNPRAVAIAQLVLWIGFFQWHYRATGTADTGDRPLLPKQKTIVEQDSVLACKARAQLHDSDGKPVTIWDGITTKTHPVTGREVPDEEARIPVYDYAAPSRPEWPEADYIVGNPPFIGCKRMIDALGDGYTEALRQAWKGAVPDSADFVMYWWRKAAELLAAGGVQRFGFITTNSIHQTFNRRVLEPFLADDVNPIHLDFAIPDHPWVDSADGAAVRIAMTVATPGSGPGTLAMVTDEKEGENGEVTVALEAKTARIAANLRSGADLTTAAQLGANAGISSMGMMLAGSGFIVTPEEAVVLGLNTIPGVDQHIKPYRNGKDLTDQPRGVMVIDAFGLTLENLQKHFPAIYQHLLIHVKPERDQNNRKAFRERWWVFGEPRRTFRPALVGLVRFITTPETAKHRVFHFLDGKICPDHRLVNFAVDDAWILAILSGAVHVRWALAIGGRLEDRPVYNKSVCFETFPFPTPDEEQKARIRDLGERLDAHRKRQQELHPDLTLTGLYNVLEKLRTGETLSDKERKIHDDGLVSVLKQIHDALDAAVLNAYGWTDLTTGGPLADRLAKADATSETLEQEILSRLVALNHERAKEEAEGKIRWLRPDFQSPKDKSEKPKTARLMPAPEKLSKPVDDKPAKSQEPWPEDLPNQFALVKRLLADHGLTPTSDQAEATITQSLTGRNTTKRRTQIQSVLATLKSMGHF